MSQYPITIFLPAAGLGERLRPVTNHLPKPLLPILGLPLIEIILERLTAVCSGPIGINLYYRPEMIRAWASTSVYTDRIQFFPEDPILGTGGAIKNAEKLLSKGPFIVHNADILLNIDYAKLIETHLSSGNIATLATHRHPRLSNVVINDQDSVIDVENPGDSRPNPGRLARKVAYTGIAVYSPQILNYLPSGVSHATVAWLDAAKAGHKVQALDFTGCYWNDIGTPSTYVSSILDTLRGNGETVFRSQKAACGKIVMDGYVVLEAESEIHDATRIRNCVVMPNAEVSGSHENQIIGPDYVINIDELEMQPSLHAREQKTVLLADPLFASYFGVAGAFDDVGCHDEAAAILIGLGGSERRYFRVRNDGKTAILMECKTDDPDYERHLVYTRFFEAHSIPVPSLIAADAIKRCALFEDLGDTSLYSYLKFPHDQDHIDDVYRSVLDILIKLHTRVTRHVHECPPLRSRIFDYQYLRWETTYFLERFLNEFKEVIPSNPAALDAEFHRLAVMVDAFPKSVIHRDFQSQNIMMTAGGMPRVIDYQGARMAPATYDVAAILWDPYYRIEDDTRRQLLGYYIDEMKRQAKDFNETTFFNSLVPCRLQRHMQALGAYAFLAIVKGKKYFLKYIPEALRLLKEETALLNKEYPELSKIVNNLQ